ncbi:amidohydrolase family protein [Candidatus Poribacteria bacterium]
MYDIVVRAGTIMDGTGSAGYKADVAIVGDSIAAIGKLPVDAAGSEIDASGKVVCPGFIDIHTHTDFSLLVNPQAESKIRQGVTTEVGGNCGSSIAPIGKDLLQETQKSLDKYGIEVDWRDMDEFLGRLEDTEPGINFATFVGNGTVRGAVMGLAERKPTSVEVRKMKEEVATAIRQGAMGLSTGLIYTPSVYASTEEIVELAKVASQHNGIYASHIRGEGATLFEAIQEAVTIGKQARIGVQIAHFKAYGEKNWGKAERALEMVDEARERGIDVTADRYPYLAGSTGLAAILPIWSRDGGTEIMLERLRDPGTSDRIKADLEVKARDTTDYWGRTILCTDGSTVADAAKERGMEPIDFVCQFLIEKDGRVQICHFGMSQDDANLIIKHQQVMIASDSSAKAPYGELGKGNPHPRGYGTFPRAIQEYVRERELVSLPEMIRKMTSMPADRLELTRRGRLKEGNYGDICIFDYENVRDNATYAEPHQYPDGIEYVLVNGQVVIENGEHTGNFPGKVIRGRPEV